jgi:hypothetical protein
MTPIPFTRKQETLESENFSDTFMKTLRHIWTGIVGGIAGAALAVLIQVIGQMTMGLPVDYLQWILLTCVGIGFLIGVMIGPRSAKPKT